MNSEKFIGEVSAERFEIPLEMGNAVVRELAPNKLSATTVSYTISQKEDRTYLEARNADCIIEYLIELYTNPDIPITRFDYEEAIDEMIKENRDYKDIRIKGYVCISLLLLVSFVVIAYLKLGGVLAWEFP